jgi:hypothetical protein
MFLNDWKKFMERPPYKQCKYNMCFSATFPSPCCGPMTTHLQFARQYSASNFTVPLLFGFFVSLFLFGFLMYFCSFVCVMLPLCLGYHLQFVLWIYPLAETFVTGLVLVPLYSIVLDSNSNSTFTALTSF